jgi:hypothetical protein
MLRTLALTIAMLRIPTDQWVGDVPSVSCERYPLSQLDHFLPHQVAAMQAGLLKVVPQAVLDLLTWQELEKKVCGDPEVTVDALHKLSEFQAVGQCKGWVLRISQGET